MHVYFLEHADQDLQGLAYQGRYILDNGEHFRPKLTRVRVVDSAGDEKRIRKPPPQLLLLR